MQGAQTRTTVLPAITPMLAFETQTLLDDEVRQRGITVPGHEDICKPERPACNPPWNFQAV